MRELPKLMRTEPPLEKLLAAKFRTLKDDPQRKLKLLRFALGRGYQYDEVSAALSHIENVEI